MSSSFQFTESFASEAVTGASAASAQSKPTLSGVSRSFSAANFARTGASSQRVASASNSRQSNNNNNNQNAVSRIAADLLQLQQGLNRSSTGANLSSLSRRSSQQQQQPRSSDCPEARPPPSQNCGGCPEIPANAPPCCGESAFLSEVEQAILRANVPLEINETEEITVNGERGLWANKQEVLNWKGVIPISQYCINEDARPEIITKRSCQRLEYVQELAIRYLRPPTPPAPGEIIITQECNIPTPPAPPLIIRQQPCRPCTPEPLVIREAPPCPPPEVGKKVITISGKRLPPPPRKVIIERLAPIPSKPQSVIIERWLPYAEVKRRVVFNRCCIPDPVVCKPRNVIVQWEAPEVNIRKEFKYLGVIKANPVEYVQRYGASLQLAENLPEFVLEIKTPDGLKLAANHQYNSLHELEGDVDALKLIDLDKEGLSEYREYLSRLGVLAERSGSSAASAAVASLSAALASSVANSSSLSAAAAASSAAGNSSAVASSAAVVSSAPSAASNLSSVSNNLAQPSQASLNAGQLDALVELIFHSIDRHDAGKISVEDAEKILLRLNSRLGRKYGEDDVNAFFQALDDNHDNTIDLEEFKKAFLTLNN